jgi:hypothetical protein
MTARQQIARLPLAEHRRQLVGIVRAEFFGGRLMPEPRHQIARRAEGALQRHLLIE